METLKPLAFPAWKVIHLSFLFLFVTSCSFPKAVRLLRNNEVDKSKPLFNKSLDHRVYDPGARFYIAGLSIDEDQSTANWLRVDSIFCELEEEIPTLPIHQIRKLNKHHSSTGDVKGARERLEKRIVDRMFESGSLTELKVLEAINCTLPKSTLDSL